MRTRRTFLRNLVGAGTVAVASFREDGLDRILAAGRATSSHRPEQLARDEDFWFEIQQAFKLDRALLLLTSGGLGTHPCGAFVDARRCVISLPVPYRHRIWWSGR